MRIISKKALRDFWERHPAAETSLRAWYQEASKANWNSPTDIRNDYPKASVLQAGRVVFNIVGNRYRLIVRINYAFGLVWIRFVGTHREYDRVDANTI